MEPITLFTNYLVGKYPGKISGVRGTGPDCWIGFTSDATEEDQININAERLSYIWDAAPVPDPDPALFISLLAPDTTINSGTFLIAQLISAAPQRFSALTAALPDATKAKLLQAAQTANLQIS